MRAKRAGKARAPAAEGREPGPGGLPLFYRRIEVLDSVRHAGLGLAEQASLGFARGANSVPLNAVEFAAACRCYPIVFAGAEPCTPLAVLGLREGENLFVDAEGRWAEDHYVPAYVRRYPFIFHQGADGKTLTLCVDVASDMVGESAPRKLFDGDRPSETAAHARDFCAAYQEQYRRTEALCRELEAAGVLAGNSGMFTLSTGERLSLANFKAVDEVRLQALADERILAWRRQGFLPLVYFHLASLGNWAALLRRLERRLAAG